MDCATFRKKISEYLDHTLSDSELEAFRKQVQSCSECAKEVKTFEVVINQASTFAKMRAPDSLWQRIESELDSEPTPFLAGLWSKLRRWRLRFTGIVAIPAPVLKVAGAATVLIVGVFIGRYFIPSANQVDVTKRTNKPLLNAQLAQRTNHFVEKSKVLLLGIVNADQTEIRNSDWHTEKNLAQHLFQEAAYLKSSLSETENTRLKMLVSELALILLEIAHIEEEHDLENIELIKSGIDGKGLLLKITLYDLHEDMVTKPQKSGRSS